MGCLAIAFLNRKGGVGKTSTCHHLAGVYAGQGKNVLLVDCDPQASLTQGLLSARVTLGLPPSRTVASLFDTSREPDPKSLIHETKIPNVFLAASSGELNRFNLPTPERYPNEQGLIAQFVAEVRPFFDVILIDCPPTLNLCSWGALLAADGVVIPVTPEDYGAQGIIHVTEMIARAARINKRLNVFGCLLTMVSPRLAVHRAYRQQLEAEYKGGVFTAIVPLLTAYKEAVTLGLPISVYRPDSPAAEAMRLVGAELLARADAFAAGELSQTDAAIVPS